MSDLILPSNTARTDDLAALRTLAAGGTIGAMNYATGMGMPMYDPSRHTNMAAGVVPLDRGQQDRLMRSHKFIRKIIETIPNQMTYRWGHLTLGGDDGDPDIINEVHTWLDNLNTKSLVNRYKGLKRAFNQAMKMAFQTGNAALVILAKDGQNFDRPINTNNLRSIEGLFLADRWSIQPDISGVYANLEMAEYFWLNDSPFNKIIQLRGGDMGRIRIHRSRVLWFRGEELSDRTLLENEGCDDSVLQGVQQSFQEYFQAVRGAGRMIVDFDVVVHKVAGLLARIDNDPSGKYQQKMMERAQINNICRSIWRAMLIDKDDEEIDHSTRNVSGYDSLLDRLVLDLQANTDLTKSELFNEYSKGLSATDKVEQENANNRTRMYQESKIDSNMYDFLKLVFACKEGPTKGKEPDKWEWKWEELYPVTPVEQAELELMRSQIDQINSSIGAYTGEEAAKSHYSGSEYNPEITIDWEEREKLKAEQEKQQAEADKLAIQMGLLPGMEQPLLPGQPKQKALPGQQPGKALPGAKSVTDSDDGFWPPLQVQAIAKKGLELFKQYGSPGSPNIMQSVFWSRQMAYGQPIPRNAVLYIKQQNDLMRIPPGGDDPKKPSYEFIAYLCRGGAAGQVWIEQMVKELAIQQEAIGQVDSEASVHMDKPCGKGFIADKLFCSKGVEPPPGTIKEFDDLMEYASHLENKFSFKQKPGELKIISAKESEVIRIRSGESLTVTSSVDTTTPISFKGHKIESAGVEWNLRSKKMTVQKLLTVGIAHGELSSFDYKNSEINTSDLETALKKGKGLYTSVDFDWGVAGRRGLLLEKSLTLRGKINVNDSDKRAIISEVKKLWTQNIFPGLPEGTVLYNHPVGGATGARARIYKRMGFGDVPPGQTVQFALVQKGKLVPLNLYKAKSRVDSDFYGDDNELSDWMEALFPDDDNIPHTDDDTPIKKAIAFHNYQIGLQYQPMDERHGKILPVGYGEFLGIISEHDGMNLDVYVGPDLSSRRVFAITQLDHKTGEFDEVKFFVGCDRPPEEIAKLYQAIMTPAHYGGIEEIPMEMIPSYQPQPWMMKTPVTEDIPTLPKADAEDEVLSEQDYAQMLDDLPLSAIDPLVDWGTGVD